MSYHLEMEKGGKPKIEMPELPEERVVPQPRAARQVQHSQQEDQEYNVHPELAKEYSQPEEIEETEEQVEEAEVVPEPVKVDSKKETNLRVLREKALRAEAAERERDELARRIQDMEMGRYQQQKPVPVEEPDTELGPDDLVDAKYLRKYDKTIKELRDELKTYKEQTTLASTDARLKARFPDIDSVVSKENIDILRYEYPELAATLNATPDMYNKAVSAYTLIKKLGISQEDLYVEDRAKAQKNAAKPKPMASIAPQQGDSPLSKANAFANGLTDDLQKQMLKEMNEARKRI